MKTNFVPALLLLLCVSLSCSFIKDKIASSSIKNNVKTVDVPTVDPNEPVPAISTDVFDTLSADIPELAKRRDEVLSAEREAINGLLHDIKAKSKAADAARLELAGSPIPGFRHTPQEVPTSGSFLASFSLVPEAMAADPDLSGLGHLQYNVIGHQIGYFTIESGDVNNGDRGQSKTIPMKADNSEKVVATLTMSVDKDTGTISTELSTTISMPLFGLEANSKVKLTGDRCPDKDGKLNISIEHSSNGRAGSAGSTSYDKKISVNIKATVDDNANLASTDFDMKQATRSNAGGRQVYVETSQSANSTDGSTDLRYGDVKTERASSQANAGDGKLSEDGLSAAFYLAFGALQGAKENWQGGGCVKIEANSPGRVEPNSSNEIPVKVRHLKDGTDVPSKVDVVLAGETSVSPLIIPKTAGTLTYVAPSGLDQKATISLTANSRRGRAKLDLNASTGGTRYRVSGKSGPVTFSGEICSLDKGFIIDGTFANGSEVQSFTPKSATSGMVNEDGDSGGCTQSGSGTYNVTLKEDGTGILEFTETVTGFCPPYSNTRTVTFRVNLTPDPTISCP